MSETYFILSEINLHILKGNYHIFSRIQSEARGSKIGMMKVYSYKFTVILESNYHIFSRKTVRGQRQ